MTEPLKPPNDAPGEFRWPAVFRRCREPVFFLNRRRRILFANAAWQALTGIPLAEARTLVCKNYRASEPGSREAVLSALCPPPEVLEGQPARTRRALTGGGLHYWDLTFLPFMDESGLLGILGRVRVRTDAEDVPAPSLPPRLLALRDRLGQWHHPDNLASELPGLRRVLDQVRLASQTPAAVLILGEAGTGKQWLARTIHQQAALPGQVFAALDCRRLPAACLEGVLFGVRGLLGRPGVGSVYLQEPQYLPRELQARLCDSVLAQSVPGRPTPRLMAGCGADPRAEVRAGRLLEDLHCALGVLTITLPPLRERLADLPALVEHLLQRLGNPARPKSLMPETWEILRAWSWPGNVRELHRVLRAASARAAGERIEAGHLPWYLRGAAPAPVRSLPLEPLLEKVERRLIELALTLSGGNKSKAAEVLALWRPSLLWRMEKFGLKPAPRRKKKSPPRGQEPDAAAP